MFKNLIMQRIYTLLQSINYKIIFRLNENNIHIKIQQQKQIMWKTASSSNKGAKKQVRKPISTNFAPKRLAINFQPPTLVLEYLVIDTGKLYHHKMRLDSILRKNNVSRNDVLNYVKTKHHLYFLNTKLKDQQILKFIDKILYRLGKAGKAKPELQKIQQRSKNLQSSPSSQLNNNQGKYLEEQQDDDFDYLNDDDEYEEDYEDYEQKPQQTTKMNKQNNVSNGYKVPTTSSFTTKTLQKPAVSPQQNKNAFMTHCQEQYEDEEEEEQNQANWDLDIEQNGDFDFV